MFKNNTAAPLNQNMNDRENEHLIAVTEKGDIKEKKEKEYEIQSDKKINFNVEFFLKAELLLIKAHKDINGIIVFYENSFDLKYIQKVKLFLGYDSIEAFFSKKRSVDAVIIGAPDDFHYAICKKAIDYGYHCLLEKPIAQNEKECIELTEAAKNKGVIVCVCYVLRYHPFYMKLKEKMA